MARDGSRGGAHSIWGPPVGASKGSGARRAVGVGATESAFRFQGLQGCCLGKRRRRAAGGQGSSFGASGSDTVLAHAARS